MNRNAALYVRSSKDRRDVSIDAQRRELRKLAKDKGLAIVKAYTDAVESAKDEDRPGFQRLLLDLKSKDREWSHLLVVDTSRLSRRRYYATVFKHEAKKRGVRILYSKLPETDPIADMVVVGVMEVFDELHSLMSKEKGLAGMAENVRQGYRAGGRAPRGYRLKQVETGATREGRAVTKSVLEPNEQAPLVARYLKGRAQGKSRKALVDALGISWPKSSLIDMERNALTYAGHTVWNRHQEFTKNEGYRGGSKLRPRSEWVVKANTHRALISHEEAHAILQQLENSSMSRSRRTPATYLLTGLLKTPSGDPWYGNARDQYRTKPADGKHRYVSQQAVESAVLDQIVKDMLSPSFVKKLTAEAKKFYQSQEQDPAKHLQPKINEVTQKIDKMMELASKLDDPDPALRQIEKLERERKLLLDEARRLVQENEAAEAMKDITENDVRKLLQSIADDTQRMNREALKDLLSSVVDRMELDPSDWTCQIRYRIGIEGRNKVASPTGVEPVLQP